MARRGRGRRRRRRPAAARRPSPSVTAAEEEVAMGAMQNPRAGGGRKWRSDAMDGPNMLPCLSASEHVNLAKYAALFVSE
jgi:hypothetical protein